LRDADVRKALFQKVLRRHARQPDTLVIEELGLRHGTARIDVAVVNGALHGYEIKSDADTLERLGGQVAIYGSVLDHATLVVGERHAEEARKLIPSWWGIKLAKKGSRNGIAFEDVKRPQKNSAIDPVAAAELLWRTEVVHVLRSLGYPERALRKPRAFLYQELSQALPLKDLRDTVRAVLKSREKWRGLRPPSSDGDSSTPIPKS
jgi:hypothetical protein